MKNAKGISSTVLDFVSNKGTEYNLKSGISVSKVLFDGANNIVRSKNIT